MTQIETIKSEVAALKMQLREAHWNEYLNTPQNKCYNPKPLLNSIAKVENALNDLVINYGHLI